MTEVPDGLPEDIERVKDLAEERLTGEYTIQIHVWNTGDYQVEAFYTINDPIDMANKRIGEPFHRETIVLDDSLTHEVRKHYVSMNKFEIIWSQHI